MRGCFMLFELFIDVMFTSLNKIVCDVLWSFHVSLPIFGSNQSDHSF